MSYDPAIRAHYDEVATNCGAAPSSTMADETIRAKETQTIIRFVSQVLARWETEFRDSSGYAARPGGSANVTMVDVGCGNGYTLGRLRTALPALRLLGVEQNEKLRMLARQSVQCLAGDVRDLGTIEIEPETVDILLCQRVLINLLDRTDQQRALENLIRLTKPGGALLFIETFASGHEALDAARAEFDLPPIPPAVHNLPLTDDFFDVPGLVPWPHSDLDEHMLSTHYFVSRVLHDVALASTGAAFRQNSHFVRFFSAALPDGIGRYSPLHVKAMMRPRA